VATAGFALMAGAGWIGSQKIWGHDTAPLVGNEAGLTLSPSELFGRDEVDNDAAVPDPAWYDTAVLSSDPASAVEEDTIPVEEDPIPLEEDRVVAEIGPPPAEEAEIVPPPELPDFVVQDPVLAIYENAMTIFRAEVDRYDADRRSFDEGLSACNPLNLSYRGVTDAFRRLEQRKAEAEAKYGESAVPTFQSALRQFTVTKTHYELTDCPMPIGG